MNNWQDLLVLALIVCAAGYVAYVLWFRLSRRANACCDSCNRCRASRSNDVQKGPHQVTIDTSERDAAEH